MIIYCLSQNAVNKTDYCIVHAPPTSKMKTEDTRPEDYEFFKQYLEFVFFNEFGKRFEECLQSLAGRTKGHLSIGGRSLKEIMLVSATIFALDANFSKRG